MAQVKFLGVGQVAQQRPGGADGGGLIPQAAVVHVLEAELLTEPCGAGQEFKAAAVLFQHGVQLLGEKFPDGAAGIGPGGEHRLPGGEAGQLVDHVGLGVIFKGGAAEFAGGDVAEGHAAGVACQIHSADVVAAPLLQHGAFGDGAGGDDTDHVPLDDALGQGRVLRLLADGHLVALGDEPGDIALGAVVGDAAHGGALLRVLNGPVPGGQGQVQLPGSHLGVLIEHLIEIAQAEKQQAILIVLLDLVILSFHGGKLCHGLTVPFLRSAPDKFYCPTNRLRISS